MISPTPVPNQPSQHQPGHSARAQAARVLAASVLGGLALALSGAVLLSWFRALGVPVVGAPGWARLAAGAYLAFGASLSFGVGLACLRAAFSQALRYGRDGPVVAGLSWAIVGAWSAHGLIVLAGGGELARALGWSTPVFAPVSVELRGEAVQARGVIARAMAEAVRDAVEAGGPAVTRLVMDSPGGSVSFGESMARLVARRGLAVEAPRRCASACLDVFMAADTRIVGPRVRLGCHQRSNALTGEPAGPSFAFASLRPAPGQEAALTSLIARCDATPPWAIHEPDLGLLVEIGAVTHVRASGGDLVPAAAFCAASPSACAASRR